MESVRKLKLSDAFVHPNTSHEFEWTAIMYNLNKGKNEELLSRCKPLQDYMYLINCIKINQSEGMSVKDAVDKAVVECINNDIMADFLRRHRAEVMDVCITEYNEKTFVDGIREEGKEIGRIEEILVSVQEGDYGPERGAQKLGITVEEFAKRMENAGYKLPTSVY